MLEQIRREGEQELSQFQNLIRDIVDNQQPNPAAADPY
jgi:hypothetical protein